MRSRKALGDALIFNLFYAPFETKDFFMFFYELPIRFMWNSHVLKGPLAVMHIQNIYLIINSLCENNYGVSLKKKL